MRGPLPSGRVERPALLAMLVLSIRTNVREINRALEELNEGSREATFPHRLERCFRAMEHDARTASLEKLARLLAAAKSAGRGLFAIGDVQERIGLLGEVAAELVEVADHLENGERHRLDASLLRRLVKASPKRPGPTLSPS